MNETNIVSTFPTKSYVKKRDETLQEIDFSKIQNRLKYIAKGYPSRKISDGCADSKSAGPPYLEPLKDINISSLTQKVIKSVVNNIQTNKIDDLTASICAEDGHIHPDYLKMASRISISNHHKNTRSRNFLGMTEYLYLTKDKFGRCYSLVNKQYYKFVENNHEQIEKLIDYKRDYNISYFGFKTLERSYLIKPNNDTHPTERPQHTWMRIAISLNMTKETIPVCDQTDVSDDSLLAADQINQECEDTSTWERIKKTYNYISNGYYTHASPTIFNAGTLHQQLLSCFLLGSDDSQEGIMKTATDISKISKWAGGIGFHINWRSSGSLIKGTNGKSSGPIPFLQINDKLLGAFNQGGKRKGSGACYVSIDHPDILEFTECRLPHKKEETTTPDLFLAVCIRDLFMERVLDNKKWSMFDPDECPGLLDSFESDYRRKYLEYEQEGRAKRVISARELLEHLAKCRIESGLPYIFYIDHANRKSNQKKIGFIRSSNLCGEIVEYSNSKEYACCTLASICLPKFVEDQAEASSCKSPNHEFPLNPTFNFKKLAGVVKVAFRNLDNIIDLNWYPVPETEVSNKRHRPVGTGIQGLADVYHKMRISFSSQLARELNKRIFETIYYACMVESCALAREKYSEYKKILQKDNTVDVITGYRIRRKYKTIDDEENNRPYEYVEPVYKTYTELNVLNAMVLPDTCGAYSSYEGSPISQGKFQFDLWDDELDSLPQCQKYNSKIQLSGMWDWDSLRSKIKKFGVRNSLTTALMPTASTSQIMGNNESFEPYTSNLYRRDTMAGQFVCINKYLMHELIGLGMWNQDIKNNIRINNGSVQYIQGIPEELKERYKTNYEISQRVIIDQEADRGAFIDQSQSANRFLSKNKASIGMVTSMDIYAWRKRLKTGQYYLRTEDFNDPQKFTIKPNKDKSPEYKKENQKGHNKKDIFIIDDKNICLSCSG